VTYTVQSNPDTTARTGRITVGSRTLTITQAAAAAPTPAPPAATPCAYAVSPTAVSLDSLAATRTATVSTTSGCAWTSIANATWITVTSGASGTGNGTVGYTVAANVTTTARMGTLTVAGKTVTVNQAGVPCTFSLTPTSKSFDAKAHTDHVNVDTLVGCSWTAVSDSSWLVITTSPASGTGDGRVDYSLSANMSPNTRTGKISIGGQTLTVTQQGQ
jgi:hypothetical protein